MALPPNQIIVYGRLAMSSLRAPFKSTIGTPKELWNADIIIDPRTPEGKTALKQIEAAAKHVAMEKFKKWPITFPSPVRYCLRDGDLKVNKKDEVRDGYAGMKYLSASRGVLNHKGERQQPPGLFAADTSPLPPDSTVPFNGCWVKAHVDLFGTDNGGKGIFCGLISVQQIKEDEPLVGGGGGGSAPTAGVFTDESEAPEDEA